MNQACENGVRVIKLNKLVNAYPQGLHHFYVTSDIRLSQNLSKWNLTLKSGIAQTLYPQNSSNQ